MGSTKGAKARADRLFSQIVRSPGRCASCGNASDLQCAHIISRRFSNTRCDEANAVPLCARCHHFFTDHPVDWGVWVLEQMGEERYAALLAQSQRTSKVVWADVVQRLKLRAKELELV